MRILYTIFLLLSFLSSFSQYVSGIVLRKDNGEAIANANVYYSSTSISTQTNSKGEFLLPFKEGHIPLVVSCVGFSSVRINEYSDQNKLTVYLPFKVNELGEVVISTSSLPRKEMEKMFCREFLGTSANASECLIENLSAVYLKYNKQKKTLTASCDEALKISNPRLGYKINYYLDHFIKTPDRTVIAGNHVFEDLTLNKSDRKVARHRANTYEGSRMQFVRALWANQLGKTGFRIYDSSFQRLPVDSVLCQTEGLEKELCLKEKIIVAWSVNNTPKALSYLTQKTFPAYINRDGFYDTNIQWTGFLTRERMGDLLPFDYNADTEDFILDEKTPAKVTIAPSSHDKSGPALNESEKLAEKIILSPENPLSDRLIVRKWQKPVRYKVCGSFEPADNAGMIQNIKSFFSRLALVTGLEISKAEDDSTANFIIIAGNVDTARGKITADAFDYLKKLKTSGFYFNSSEEGFSSVATLINIKEIPQYNQIWPVVQKFILKGMGFFGSSSIRSSLFYDGINFLPPRISESDSTLIRILYNNAVKSGMSKEELEAAIATRGIGMANQQH